MRNPWRFQRLLSTSAIAADRADLPASQLFTGPAASRLSSPSRDPPRETTRTSAAELAEQEATSGRQRRALRSGVRGPLVCRHTRWRRATNEFPTSGSLPPEVGNDFGTETRRPTRERPDGTRLMALRTLQSSAPELHRTAGSRRSLVPAPAGLGSVRAPPPPAPVRRVGLPDRGVAHWNSLSVDSGRVPPTSRSPRCATASASSARSG
jgi:hypothetical protein